MEEKYKLAQYSLILAEYLNEFLDKGLKLNKVKNANLNMKYAIKCLDVEKADVYPPDNDEENGEHGEMAF